MLTEWSPEIPFIDPMCGSGTLPVEAGLMALGIPPGAFRKEFGFTKWQNYDKELHYSLLNTKENKENTHKVDILGMDIDENAIKTSQVNAESAGLSKIIRFETKPFEEFTPQNIDQGLVIMNPPYDVKMKKENINDFYKNIGDALKNNFDGFDVWIFSGNKSAIKSIGLHANKKITLFNGPIECKFHYFSIYKGSLKKKKLDL